MAFRYEGEELIMDGYEKGISDGPYAIYSPSALGPVQNTGMVDLSFGNLTGIPGEFSVQFPLADSTMTGGTFYIANNKTSFLTSPDVPSWDYWVIDSRSQVWQATITAAGTTTPWTLMGHVVVQSSDQLSPQGFVYWKGYLFAFWQGKPYYSHDSGASWTDWSGTIGSTNYNAQGSFAFVAADDVLYFCNGSYIGSILQNLGASFDPTDSTTYTPNLKALSLPSNESSTYIAQLYPNLLIGGVTNKVYVWNILTRDPQFDSILFLPENYTRTIVSSNNNAYIFAGNTIIPSGKGNIYITNGSQVDLYKKLPDNFVTIGGTVSDVQEPYWVFGDAMYHRNRLYFGAQAYSSKTGSVISDTGDVWCIDINSQALFRANKLATGSFVRVINPIQTGSAGTPLSGLSYFVGDQTKLDYSSTTMGQTARVIFDKVPVGTNFVPKTYEQAEIKLAVALASGESVALTVFTDVNPNGLTVGTMTSTDGMSKVFTPLNFQGIQWLQPQVVLTPTNTNPTYVRMRDLRFR